MRDQSYPKATEAPPDPKARSHPLPSLLPPGFRLPLSTQTGRFRLLLRKTGVQSAPKPPRLLLPCRLGWLPHTGTPRDSRGRDGLTATAGAQHPARPRGALCPEAAPGRVGARGPRLMLSGTRGHGKTSVPGADGDVPAVKEPSPAGSPRKAPSRPPPSRQVLTSGQDSPARSGPARPRSLHRRCSPRCRCRRSARAVEARASPRGASRPRRSAHPPIGCERGVICIAAPRPWQGVNHGRRGADGGAAAQSMRRAGFLRLLLRLLLLLLRPLGKRK